MENTLLQNEKKERIVRKKQFNGKGIHWFVRINMNLRTIIEETNWQIIISTHEESFYEIMKVKLNPQNYNSKFLVFKEEGKVEEDIDF